MCNHKTFTICTKGGPERMKTRACTVVMGMVVLSLVLGLVLGAGKVTASSSGEGADEMGGGRRPCGEMEIIQVEEKGDLPSPVASYIVDAWTTNHPYNPWNEVYTFQVGVDTLAFVTEYYFAEGGFIPVQHIRVWDCGTLRVRGTCEYEWTVGPLPPGFTWLLVNYYPAEVIGPNWARDYDWVTKVGDAFLGYPNPGGTRPECFTVAP